MADGFNPPTLREPFGVFTSAAWGGKGEPLYISGQIAETRDAAIVGLGDVKAQTRQTLENIKTILEHAGGTLDDIATMKVYVKDMRDLHAIHEVRAEYFNKPYPASTLVQVTAFVVPDCLLEIDAIAHVKR